ncbi:MAG: hypothetical protein LBC97_05755 [Bifidobacteriaceae bacterium]|jgi:hypothetical protein|nr:hypothetical protein [Bifidobacteriaceae bacterium]
MSKNSGIELAAAIDGLRRELEAAAEAGKARDLRFEVQAVELELQVAATTAGSGSAGVKWWLIEAGVEGSHEVASTQTVRLTLTPRAQGAAGNASSDLVLLSAQDG